VKALLLALLLAGAAGCKTQTPPSPGPTLVDTRIFPPLSGRVVDAAGLRSPAQEAALAAKAERLERQVGPQYVVVTVPSLNGHRIEDYGVDLARHWGIGSRERNDGLLLIVAPAEKMVRIEVGYGLEKRVTDPYAKRVIEEQALPRFRQGRFPEGIEASTDALMARLRSPKTEADIVKEDKLVL
jgi:uncharacterized protein